MIFILFVAGFVAKKLTFAMGNSKVSLTDITLVYIKGLLLFDMRHLIITDPFLFTSLAHLPASNNLNLQLSLV